MLYFLFIALPALLMGTSVLESFKHDMLELNEAYRNMANQQIELDYTLYKSVDDKTPSDTYHATIYYNGERRYIQMKDYEKVETATWQLVIDHANKSMYLFRQPIENIWSSPENVMGVDLSWLDKVNEQIQISREESPHAIMYNIAFPSETSSYGNIGMSIAPKSKFIQQLSLVFNNTRSYFEEEESRGHRSSKEQTPLNSKLVIDFHYKSHPDIQLSAITLDQYISVSPQAATPIGKYASYTLYQ